MCRASAGPGRPSATTSSLCACAACMSFESRGSASAALASSWPTTSHAACPSASVASCTGPAARTWANSGNGSSRSYSPHAASAGWQRGGDIVGNLSQAGTQQVDHRQAPVDDLADRGLRADPAALGTAQPEAVVDEDAVNDRLARRVEHLDGVEVREPRVETGGHVGPA